MEDKSTIKLRDNMIQVDKQIHKMSDELLVYFMERACHELDLRSKQYNKPSIDRLKRFQNK